MFTLYAFKKTMESYIDFAHEHATIWATLCTPKKKKILNTVHKMVTVCCM